MALIKMTDRNLSWDGNIVELEGYGVVETMGGKRGIRKGESRAKGKCFGSRRS